jgi:nitrate reductase gamma subunit
MDNFLFAVFPYVAFSLAIAGGLYRYFAQRFSYSSLSSQFLENRALRWGSVPWHYGIIVILLAHLLGGLFPQAWAFLLGDPTRLLILELVGMSLGIWAFFGIIILIVRRLKNPRVLEITSGLDWILLLLLAVQVASGIFIAFHYRWGSLWYLDTAVPWFGSLARFDPQFEALTPLPWMVKVHAFNGFLLIALFPFTRLVHVFSAPLSYIWRPYQVFAWNRRPEKSIEEISQMEKTATHS